MAKFGDKVFDFKEVLKYFRTPVSYSVDKSFLNVGKNSVVKVLDYKPLHTWTLMHPHQFTTPVVYSSGKIYCVMDNNVLMRWSPDEDNLVNAEKIQFQETVFAVIPTEEQLFVWFNSGKYAVVDSSSFADFKLFNFVFLKEDEELIWMDTCETSKAIEVFCLAYIQKSQKNVVYYFTVNKEDKSTSNLTEKILTHEQAILKSWCLNYKDSSFLSLWSDGTIFSHNLKESKDVQLISFKDVNANTIMTIDSLDLTHIVIAKSSLKQKECSMEIWDSKCGVPKAKKILKTPNLVSIQILAVNSVIFLSCNDELIAVPFHIENPMFSAAVGRSQAKSNETFEYSWNNEMELLPIPSEDETKEMEVDNSQDSIELVVQKLLNENSDYLMYIRESELAKLLQLALRHKKEENDHANSNQVLDEETCILLNNILSASFNDVLLMKYLKMFNSEEVLIALKLLLSYLNHTIKIPSNLTKRPSDLQVVNWITLIIQTHMEDLLFSKDKTSQKLLKQLKKALSAKMEEYEDFECIQNYFSVIKKKSILPQKCYTGKYTIESLDIFI